MSSPISSMGPGRTARTRTSLRLSRPSLCSFLGGTTSAGASAHLSLSSFDRVLLPLLQILLLTACVPVDRAASGLLALPPELQQDRVQQPSSVVRHGACLVAGRDRRPI